MTVLVPPAVRPAAPRSAVAGAAAVGLLAAYALPDVRPGVGVLLVLLAATAVVLRVAGVRPRGWSAVHAVLAVLLTACAVLRDAPWLVALDLLAAAGLASLALVPARSWPAVLRGVVEVPYAAPWAVAWVTRGAGRLPRPVASPLLRGVALTALLLAVFVPLLVSADPAFARLAERALPGVPRTDLLVARVLVGALVAALVAGALLVATAPRPAPVVAPPVRRLERASEWALPLWSLVVLLACFLGVQASVLLGGEDHVLRSAGVTYASYARQGFGQLLAVTALVLAVVAAAARWAPRAARPALGALCGLALVVDASAFARLRLYGEAYGLTRLRLTATSVTVGLALVLVLVLVAGLRPGRWLPHAVAATVGAALLVLTAADPDARIAEGALARGDRADLAYLSGLSADAVPVLDRLPEPARSCVLPEVADAPWTGANLSRARAARLLADRPARAC